MAEGNRVFNINGNYIEKQEIHVENGGVLNFGSAKKPTEDSEVDDRVEALLPFFYNEKETVEGFLRRVDGASAMDVVNVVNDMLRAKTVSDVSCNKPLWEVLTRLGIYSKTLANWNSQIRR